MVREGVVVMGGGGGHDFQFQPLNSHEVLWGTEGPKVMFEEPGMRSRTPEDRGRCCASAVGE